jgi:MarR family transcriptional regulator, transcriptional regulator for hemolysin
MQSRLKYRTALLRCARLLSDEFNELLLPYQLNYSLWQVVYLLHEKSESTSIDIAKYLNVSKPSIAKRVNTLETLGLIDHVKSPDKRQKVLKLSPHGEHLFILCSKAIDQYESDLLASLPKAQLEQSFQVLNTLVNKIISNKTGCES